MEISEQGSGKLNDASKSIGAQNQDDKYINAILFLELIFLSFLYHKFLHAIKEDQAKNKTLKQM